MIQTVKHNELARKEYHILPAALMDAFDEGIEQGKSLGLAEGKSLGLAEGEARGRSEGSHQAKLETAKTMLTMGYPLVDICKISGLTQEEVESIGNS